MLRADRGDGFQVPDSEVAARLFHSGKRSREDVEAFARAIGGRDSAAGHLLEYAASSLRSYAMKPDGALDARKWRGWMDRHHEALRALDALTGGPQLRARFQKLGQAQEMVDTLDAEAAALDKALTAGGKALGREIDAGRAETTRTATAERKRTLADFQTSAARFFLNDADPVKAVGAALQARNAPAAFAELVGRMGGDADAIAGLRRAVVDHMRLTLRGNTEAGDSGLTLWQSDAFQTFMKRHEPALRRLFTADQIGAMKAVAADLQRAGRSVAGSRVPGGSDTAQNAEAMARLPGMSVLSRIVHGAGGAGSGAMFGGPVGAIAGAVTTGAYAYGRALGLEKVNQLITQAMLEPSFAASLLRKVPPKAEAELAGQIARHLEALGITAAARATTAPDREQRRGRQPDGAMSPPASAFMARGQR